jgi:hypothetical protein
MQANLKKGDDATLEERTWLETAEARCANAPSDDSMLQLLAKHEERRRTDPDYGRPDKIERELQRRSEAIEKKMVKPRPECGLKLLQLPSENGDQLP